MLSGCPAGVGLARVRPWAAGGAGLQGWGATAHLDLLNGMHNEGVLQVLHGPLHPVVEGCSPLGVLQVQLVNGLQKFLCPLGVSDGEGWGGA